MLVMVPAVIAGHFTEYSPLAAPISGSHHCTHYQHPSPAPITAPSATGIYRRHPSLHTPSAPITSIYCQQSITAPSGRWVTLAEHVGTASGVTTQPTALYETLMMASVREIAVDHLLFSLLLSLPL